MGRPTMYRMRLLEAKFSLKGGKYGEQLIAECEFGNADYQVEK